MIESGPPAVSMPLPGVLPTTPPSVHSSVAPMPAEEGPRPGQTPEFERETVRVLLIEDLPQVAGRVHDLLEGHDHIRLVETVTQTASIVEHIARVRPDVLLIDALLQGQESGVAAAKRVRSLGHSLPIIMITTLERPLIVGDGMGLTRALTMPLEAETLSDTITQLDVAHRGSAPARLSGTCAIYSGKGGVGRTTLGYNLAVAASRCQGARVALVDGDLQSGGLRVMLDVPSDAPSVLRLPSDHISADDVASVMWHDSSGIDVLLAPELLEEADMVSTREFKTTLAILGRVYDVVIVDVPTVLNDMTLAMLDSAATIVYVVTPDSASVRQARRCIQALEAAGYAPEKLRVLLNKAGSPGLPPDAVSAALSRPIDAIVPFEPLLVGTESLGAAPLMDAHPGSPTSLLLLDLPGMLAAS